MTLYELKLFFVHLVTNAPEVHADLAAILFIASQQLGVEHCPPLRKSEAVLRAQRGWTQTILADRAELTREHLSEIERGRKEIGIRTLDSLTRALGVSLSKFFADPQAAPRRRFYRWVPCWILDILDTAIATAQSCRWLREAKKHHDSRLRTRSAPYRVVTEE